MEQIAALYRDILVRFPRSRSGVGAFPSPARTWYLRLAIALFPLMGVISPPFEVPDELTHFARAYQTSEGKLTGTRLGDEAGSWLPASILDTVAGIASWVPVPRHERIHPGRLAGELRRPLEPERIEFVDYANTVRFGPLPYLPSAAAIWLGRQVGASPLALLYGARAATASAVAALTWLALGLVPGASWLFLTLVFVPVAVYLGASVSADAITSALAFLAIALFLRAGRGEGPLGRGTLTALFAVTAALSLAKQLYFPLCLLFLLIRPERLGGRRRYVSVFALLLLGNVVLLGLWTVSIRHLMVPLGEGVSMQGQGALLLRRPGIFLGALLHTLQTAPTVARDYLGMLSWQNLLLPAPLRTATAVLLFAAAVGSPRPSGLSLRDRALLVAVFGIEALLIALLAYLTWNPVGAPIIDGFYGRYFVPLGPLVFLPLSGLCPLPRNVLGRLVPAGLIVISLWTLHSIAARYYLAP